MAEAGPHLVNAPAAQPLDAERLAVLVDVVRRALTSTPSTLPLHKRARLIVEHLPLAVVLEIGEAAYTLLCMVMDVWPERGPEQPHRGRPELLTINRVDEIASAFSSALATSPPHLPLAERARLALEIVPLDVLGDLGDAACLLVEPATDRRDAHAR